MSIQPFLIPQKIEEVETTEKYGKFIISPLERGYGITVGNAVRRVLLSSIPGAAIISCRIDGVSHEFSTIPNVIEDITQVILNLKRLRLEILDNNTPKTIVLKSNKKGELKGGDITTDGSVRIVNPEQHILTMTGKKKFSMDLTVDSGYGYVSAENFETRHHPIGTIFIDALFSPVLKVNYVVENTRVGQRTDYAKLILEIWTDGILSPESALKAAGKILRDHMTLLIKFELEGVEEEEIDEEKEKMRKLLSKPVDELILSIRANNCMKIANIKTIGDLVQKTEKGMLAYPNFGKKSLAELKGILKDMELSFNMDVSKYLPQK